MASPLSFLLIGLLLAPCGALVSPEDLKQISQNGSKYINEEVENAANGVKTMKTLMEKTGKEHKDMLKNIEDTKHKKEEALKQAQESKQQLNESTTVCNETMMALWEECKPCLKQTCMTFYSKTCSSGAGLVGRQFDDYLSHASPFAIWINDERIDNLEEKDEMQRQKLEDLEESYDMVEDNVNRIFLNSASVFEPRQPLFSSPFSSSFWNFLNRPISFADSSFPFVLTSPRRDRSDVFDQGFHGSFQNLFKRTQQMMDRARRLLEQPEPWNNKPNSSEVVEEKGNGTDNRMVCRELRRNSASCLKMKDKCEKCKEILSVDCSGKQSAQSVLQKQFEQAMRLAEKFTSQHEGLLQRFQDRMLNTTSILDDLNKQYGWVSKLANLTGKSDEIFQVTTVMSKSSDEEGPANTTVTVKLLDSEPITFMLPGDITINDPAFSEIVAKEALKQYKKEKEAIEA